jgi:hypothetical protein
MTRIEAANDRTAEGDAAMTRGDYAAAARAYTHAAEQLEAIWWDMHRERGNSPDAQNMRRKAREAIQRRDQMEAGTRVRLEGRIGGWQE